MRHEWYVGLVAAALMGSAQTEDSVAPDRTIDVQPEVVAAERDLVPIAEASPASPAAARELPQAAGPLTTLEAGPHHRLVEQVRAEKDATGETKLVPHRWVELATGLNRLDEKTQTYVPAEALWEELDSGHVVARKTAHQLILSPEIGREGAIEMWGPGDLHLRSTILGVGVVDSVSGKNCLLAGVKDHAELERVSDTEVLIRDAFDTLNGDIRYTLGLGSFEQDLILREQIAPELLANLDINPKHARLFLMTEFFQPPQPQLKESRLGTRSGQPLADATIDFGASSIGAGRAFAEDARSDQADEPSVPVGKEWKLLEGRRFLIESVQYEDLAPLMEKLPTLDEARVEQLKTKVSRTAALPKAKTTRQAKAPRFEQGRMVLGETRVASTAKSKGLATNKMPGATIDYVFEYGQATLTLQGDTTYLILGPVTVTGTTIIEGGSVIKYAATGSPRLTVNTVDCRTDKYRQAVFTSVHDDTVGEVLMGFSDGYPWTTYCATVALQLPVSTATTLEYLRISHAQTAIYSSQTYTTTTYTLRHLQIVHCQKGVDVNGVNYLGNNYCQKLYAGNVLFQNVNSPFYGSYVQATAEHCTVDGATALASLGGSGNALTLRNSILANVVSLGSTYGLSASYNGFWNTTPVGPTNSRWTSPASPFHCVGAGAHYLGSASTFQDKGTSGIDPALADALKRKTTYPPIEFSTTIATDTVWQPTAPRDTDAPDLGYHYDPLDCVVSGLAINNATLLLTNGVAVGVYGTYGLELQSGARLRSEGNPLNLNRLVRHQLVQEQANASWPCRYPAALLKEATSAVVPPSVQLRFTDLAQASWGGDLFNGGTLLEFMAVTDCQLAGGTFRFMGNAVARTLALTNNLFERVTCEFGNTTDNLTAYGYNNLFWHSEVNLNPSPGSTWTWKDNVFDYTLVTQNANGIPNGNNAYTTNVTLLRPTASNNRIADTFAYVTGILGRYYLAATSPLINQGSDWSSWRGLYHYTTQTNQSKEADTYVDIGLHYVALGRNMALKRPASQSTTYPNEIDANRAQASRAVDGNTSGAYSSGSVSHTLYETRPWWQVDLGGLVWIDEVRVWNRTDTDTEARLQNFKVFVSDTDLGPTFNPNGTVPSGTTAYLWPGICGTPTAFSVGANGRFVRVQILHPNNEKTWLNIAEVEVFRKDTPVDTDGDAVPDYLEDRNGDNYYYPPETDSRSGTGSFRRFGHWRFNNSLTSDEGITPVQASGIGYVPSYDGQALAPLQSGATLRYPCRDANGSTVHLQRGAIRFTYKPSWYTSGSGATRPTTEMMLFDAGQWEVAIVPGPVGGVTQHYLVLRTYPESGGALTERVRVAFPGGIKDQTGIWTSRPFTSNSTFEITVCYTPSSSWFEIDGVRQSTLSGIANFQPITYVDPQNNIRHVFTGAGIPFLPPAGDVDTGFYVGSSAGSTSPASGVIDELEIFNAPIGTRSDSGCGAMWGQFARRYQWTTTVAGGGTALNHEWVQFPRPWGTDPYAADAHTFKQQDPGTGQWTTLSSDLSCNTLTTTLAAGTAARYRRDGPPIVTEDDWDPYLTQGKRSGYGELIGSVQKTAVDSRGRVLLMIDSSVGVANALNELSPSGDSYLDTLKKDLIGDGWKVTIIQAARQPGNPWTAGNPLNAEWCAAVTANKQAILAEFNAPGSDLKGVILLGHVAIPYSGYDAEDGHSDHKGAWPADSYYASTAASGWTDDDEHANGIAQFANLHRDGKFDQTWLPPLSAGSALRLQLWVGRIDFDNLPGIDSEPNLIKRYIAKSHTYRNGGTRPRDKIHLFAMDGNFEMLYPSATVLHSRLYGWKEPWEVFGDIFCMPWAWDSVWGIHGGYGGVDRIAYGYNASGVQWSHYSTEWCVQNGIHLFYLLRGSYFLDWSLGPNNFIRSCLTSPTHGLIGMCADQFYCNPVWQFEALASGGCFGDVLVDTFNQQGVIGRDSNSPSCRTTYILGDPTLRAEVVSPPTNVTTYRDYYTGVVSLSWAASSEPVLGYYVYRADGVNWNVDASFVRRTASLVQTSDFSEVQPTSAVRYMVRAAKLVTTGSGSYINLSQGAFCTFTP